LIIKGLKVERKEEKKTPFTASSFSHLYSQQDKKSHLNIRETESQEKKQRLCMRTQHVYKKEMKKREEIKKKK
jgi:hypothetical protein